MAFVHISAQNRSKLDPKSAKCIFLGYSSNQKGYKCYSPHNRKFFNSMDMTFFEDQPFYPKTDIQGENSQKTSLEYQFWDCYPDHNTHSGSLPSSPVLIHSCSPSPSHSSLSHFPLASPGPLQSQNPQVPKSQSHVK